MVLKILQTIYYPHLHLYSFLITKTLDIPIFFYKIPVNIPVNNSDMRFLTNQVLTVAWGGRKRTGTGDIKTAGRTAGPSGAGERGATTKILSR